MLRISSTQHRESKMSKVYPSNLTPAQYQYLSPLIPEPKPGGRPREVEILQVLNAIFYVLVEGVRWRSLPGDFPPIALWAFKKGRRYIHTFASGEKTARGCRCTTVFGNEPDLSRRATRVRRKPSSTAKT